MKELYFPSDCQVGNGSVVASCQLLYPFRAMFNKCFLHRYQRSGALQESGGASFSFLGEGETEKDEKNQPARPKES